MREVTMFEAEDGTLFKNEADCITHEQLILASEIEGQVKCWNYDGVEISMKDIVAHPSDIYYIEAKTEEAMDAVCEIMSESNCFCDIPTCKPGRHFISDIADRWVSMDELEAEYFTANEIFRR